MSGPKSRLAGSLALVILGLAVVAPSGAQVSPSPEASPGPAASLLPEASALGLEAQAILAEVFAQTAESPDEAAAAARAAEIERSGLAALDPEAAARLAELEAQAAEQFATFLAEAPSLPEPSPSAQAGTFAFLVAAAPGPREDDNRFSQGGSTISSIGELLGWVRSAVGDFKPNKETGRTPSEPFVSADQRYRIVQAQDRDTLTLIIEATERYSVPGTGPDSSPFEVIDTGGTTLQIDTCPDDGGTITVSANASGTYDVVGEGLSYHASLDTRDLATVTVGPDAEISGRQHSLTVRGTAVGDRPAFVGGEGAVDSQLGASLTWSGALGGTAAPSVSVTTAEGVDARDLRSAFTGGAFTAALVDAAIDAAEMVWQDGRCLELVVEPPGKLVDPGSETDITATIEHKAFEDEIKRDVRATLAGTEEVDPLDEPVPAAATFTYTATTESQGQGTITFRSVSNRGIAERSETYVVEQRLLLDVDIRTDMRTSGVTISNAVKARGLELTLVPADNPGAPPHVLVHGAVRLSHRYVTPDCTGRVNRDVELDSAPDTNAIASGDPDDRRLFVFLGPANPSQNANYRLRCRSVGAVPIQYVVTDLWPEWSAGGVEIPLVEGTVTVDGSEGKTHYRGVITIRRDSD